MLMSPSEGETAVHGGHCPGDMAVRMREVLARPWVGVHVPLVLVCLIQNKDKCHVEKREISTPTPSPLPFELVSSSRLQR